MLLLSKMLVAVDTWFEIIEGTLMVTADEMLRLPKGVSKCDFIPHFFV